MNDKTTQPAKIDKSHFVAIATAVGAALITMISGVVTTYLNNTAELNLETKKFETTLILEAIKDKNRETASEMLIFLVDSGLLEDNKGRIKEIAKNKKVPFLGRGAIPYKSDFIESIFAQFNSSTELNQNFRAILIELADNLVNHRWNRVATFFEPGYFYEQLTFLSGNRDIEEVFKQYIQEAFVRIDGVDYDFNIWDRKGPLTLTAISKIAFLDILPSTHNPDNVIVSFKLTLSNGTNVVVGYEFMKQDLYIVGAVG